MADPRRMRLDQAAVLLLLLGLVVGLAVFSHDRADGTEFCDGEAGQVIARAVATWPQEQLPIEARRR